MPRPKSLAGRVAIVTGGAGGIGSATAARYLSEGACVMLADIDAEALASTRDALAGKYGKDVVATVEMNVTSEDAVAQAYADLAVDFGGVDIVVSNAGIASSAPVEETTLALWNRNMEILSTGYFLVSRAAFGMLKSQDIGGAIVFVASKNGLAASPNASAYCTAKASEIHLARCLALEGAPHGIRVNVVNPDAVLQRVEDLVGRMAGPARQHLQDRQGGAGGNVPPAQPAEALGPARGHRRGLLLPGVGRLVEIDGEHHQCRRRQRAELHAVNATEGGRPTAGGRGDD